jgi:thioredoxin-related protein
MRKLFAVTALCLVTGLVATTVRSDPPAGYPFVKYDEGLQQARRIGKKIFLYYGRYGCGYCDKTNKESFSDAGLKATYTRNYVLVYVDAESNRRMTLPNGERITEFDLGARLKAKVTPVFQFLEPDGTPIASYPGFQSVKDFTAIDRYVQSGQYKTKTLAEFTKAAQ